MGQVRGGGLEHQAPPLTPTPQEAEQSGCGSAKG